MVNLMSLIMIDIALNNFIRYIAASRTKIASVPKMATPIALTYFSKHLLDFTRGTTLSALNKLTNRYMRGNSNKKITEV